MDKKNIRVGSNDVAKLAGVSRSAVSRAFSDQAYIADETRERVMRAADLLGYRPNVLARSLTTQRTHIIGVVTTHLENPFYAELLQQLTKTIQVHGLSTLVLLADGASNDDLISRLLSYQVDGLILTNTSLSSGMALRCARGGKPVVTINRYLEIENIAAVTCDNERCGADVAELLVNSGCKRIAFMAGDPNTSSTRDRERGFVRQLSARGLPLHSTAVGHYSHEGGIAAARQLLGAQSRPDAVFCANDLMALALLDVARSEFGLNIPEDLSVVGFDNSAPANWPAYRLTSVDQDMPRMVELAVGELLARLEGQQARPCNLKVEGRLVPRESTRTGS